MWLNELPRRADHPAYFGLANVTQTNPFGRRQQQPSHRCARKSMPQFGAFREMERGRWWQALCANENQKLRVEPTVVVPPEVHLQLPQTGPLVDPLSSVLGPPSSGTGSGRPLRKWRSTGLIIRRCSELRSIACCFSDFVFAWRNRVVLPAWLRSCAAPFGCFVQATVLYQNADYFSGKTSSKLRITL